MKPSIEKVVVLGAGTMGARIAAHFANAGVALHPPRHGAVRRSPLTKRPAGSPWPTHACAIASCVLDSKPPSSPAPPRFSVQPPLARITLGNFEDDLAWCAEADWIIEVVAENLEIKQRLLERVARASPPGTIVTTNTSGLPIRAIAADLGADFQSHWAGTHFFNPPRYMKLVELIPGPPLGPKFSTRSGDFCDRRLGKGVVRAKDTPNFIANRIGTFSILNALRLMDQPVAAASGARQARLRKGGRRTAMTVEEVDACTGPAIGWPKSATFRTARYRRPRRARAT